MLRNVNVQKQRYAQLMFIVNTPLLSRPLVFFRIIPDIMLLINHIYYANYYAGLMDANLFLISKYR